jgi:hypothetical protein
MAGQPLNVIPGEQWPGSLTTISASQTINFLESLVMQGVDFGIDRTFPHLAHSLCFFTNGFTVLFSLFKELLVLLPHQTKLQ